MGVAIAMEGVVILQGLTPTETQVKSLILWLTEQNHMLYVTDGLSRDYPLAVTFDNAPAGLIAILLPKTSENAILWFRREYRHQVDWAGDPDKPASLRSDGSWDLHPRGSFERWTRMTENSSRGWLDCEVDYAQALHQLLSDFLLQRTRLVNTFNDRRSSLEDECDGVLL